MLTPKQIEEAADTLVTGTLSTETIFTGAVTVTLA